MAASRLRLHHVTVPSEWIDYNHHLTEGYYAVAFADASDALLLHIGFDAEYRATQRGAFYTVETYTRFLREVREGAEVAFDTTVLGADPKRLHLHQSMWHVGEEYEAATQEVMLLHVDLDTTKVRPMSDQLLAAASELALEHGSLPRPHGIGRSIRPVP